MSSRHKLMLGLALVGLGGAALLTQRERGATPSAVISSEVLRPFALEMHYGKGELGQFPRDALPKTFPASWINYSTTAVLSKLEGSLRYRVAVDPYGEVAECEVIASSGAPAVDKRVCGSIITNARFYPAMDRNQEPVRGAYEGNVEFQLSGQNTYVGVLASIGRDGNIRECKWANAEFASGDPMTECRARLKVWQQYAQENSIPMPVAEDIPLSFPPQLLEAGRTVR